MEAYDGPRKLASIQKVISVDPIKGADFVEKLTVLGYELVGKKDEFKVNDLIVYFECDSILPVHPLFFFLEDVKYRIKIRKFRKQISMGLALPLSILSEFTDKDITSFKEDDDLTSIIGVGKYEKNSDNVDPEKTIKHNKFVKFMMKFRWFRFVYWAIFPKRTKGNWPEFLQKSDEIRLQSCPSILYKNMNETFYYMEKFDGRSATFFYNNKLDKKRFGILPVDKGNGFGVCSRNLRLIHEDKREWWAIAKKYDIENKLRQYFKVRGKSIAIQMEIVGPGCNGNKYNLNEIAAYCFSVFDIDNQKYLSYNTKDTICKLLDIPTIERLDNVTITEETNVKWFINLSNRKSLLNDKVLAEGIVCRHSTNDNISFKVINPTFIFDNEE